MQKLLKTFFSCMTKQTELDGLELQMRNESPLTIDCVLAGRVGGSEHLRHRNRGLQ